MQLSLAHWVRDWISCTLVKPSILWDWLTTLTRSLS